MSLSTKIIHWLEQQIGTVSYTEQLLGSTSTTLYQIINSDHQKFVLRLYDNLEWLAFEPDLCIHEAAALEAALAATVTTPKVIAHEPDARVAGVPLLLMTMLDGVVWLKPDDMSDWLRQSAEALAAIHAVNAPDFGWQFYRYRHIHDLQLPPWSSDTKKWSQIIDMIRQPEPKTPQIFIHRDYHMVNFLWDDRKLSGVVDWINACIGPAGMDIGHMRFNLMQLYSIDIAEQFLEAYQRANPTFDYHPYWDLVAIGDTALYNDHPPSVYQPWIDFGMESLSDDLMRERVEAYAASVLAKF